MAASSVNLPGFSHKLLKLDESSAMSSAKSRCSNTVAKFHRIPLLLSVVIFLMIQSVASKNKNPDIAYPCFTSYLNQSDISHLSITARSNPSYMPIAYFIAPHNVPRAFSVYRIEAFFNVHKVHNRLALHSFARSKMFLYIKICSTVLLFGLNPACSFRSLSRHCSFRKVLADDLDKCMQIDKGRAVRLFIQ